MQNRKFSERLTGLVGSSEVERGTRLGILAGGVALVLLFGTGAVVERSSNTVDFSQGQYAGLVIQLALGAAALLFALILAYFAGWSAPEVKTGEATQRTGMLSGAITMLLYWVGQTIFALVDSARAPQGLQLDAFLRTRLIAGLGFFVVGGLFGWWGYRSALRRARSILTLPGGGLPLARTNGGRPLPETPHSAASDVRTLESAPVSNTPVEQPPRTAEKGTLAAAPEEERALDAGHDEPTNAEGQESATSEERSG